VQDAGRVQQRGAQRDVDPAWVGRLQVKPPAGLDQSPQDRRRHRHRPRAEQRRERGRIENRLAGDVEGADDRPGAGQHVGARQVVGVHDLDREPLDVRDDRDQRGSYERLRHEGPEEVAGERAGCLRLQHHGGPDAHDAALGVLGLQRVQHPLGL
jgi:hypothetical protein